MLKLNEISLKIFSFLKRENSTHEFIAELGNFLIDNNLLSDLLFIITDNQFSFLETYSFKGNFILQNDYLKTCLKQFAVTEHSDFKCFTKDQQDKNIMLAIRELNANRILYFLGISDSLQKTFFEEITDEIKFALNHITANERFERYFKIYQNIDDAVFIHDSQGKIYDLNKKAEELLGLNKEIIFRLNFIELFHNKTLIKRKIEELKFYDTTDFDYHIIGSSGGKTDINISLKYFDKSKDLILSILKNISEKVWVEEALNRNLTLVLTLLETIPNPIYYTDENSIYLGCNEAFANFIGQPKEKIIGNKIEFVASKELAKKIIEINNEVLNAQTQTVEREVKLPYPNGEEHYFISTITKFNMQGEKFSGLIGIMVDVTRQKKAEQKLNALYNNLKHELEIAAKVQKYLLPGWFISKKSLHISSSYNPSAAIGGDLYDLIPINDDKYIVYIADISGHGVQAALIMTAVKSIINILVQSYKTNLSLYKIVTHLNRLLMKNIFSDNYMTLLISLIDTKEKKITFYNAGHPPLLVFSPISKDLAIYDKKGDIPIGWVNDYQYQKEYEVTIDFGDENIYFFYTDGVYECQTPDNKIMGFENFTELIRNEVEFESIVSFPHRIRDYFLKKGYDLSNDDFTLVAVTQREKDTLLETFKLDYGDLRNYADRAVLFLKNKGVDTKTLNYFELILIELLNNIFVHGINKDESTEITVEVEYSDKIIIRIWDILKEWKLPPKKVAKNLDKNKYATQGRGFQIIYSVCDEVKLYRIADMNYLYVKLNIKEK